MWAIELIEGSSIYAAEARQRQAREETLMRFRGRGNGKGRQQPADVWHGTALRLLSLFIAWTQVRAW